MFDAETFLGKRICHKNRFLKNFTLDRLSEFKNFFVQKVYDIFSKT